MDVAQGLGEGRAETHHHVLHAIRKVLSGRGGGGGKSGRKGHHERVAAVEGPVLLHGGNANGRSNVADEDYKY